MVCQSCNHREATCHFSLSQNGRSSEAHLCAECAGRYAGQYQQRLAALFAGAPGAAPFLPSGWALHGGERSQTVPGPAPSGVQTPVIDPVFRQRRELELLRRELREALAMEDYERAAGLRDQIRRAESGADQSTQKEDEKQ